MKRIILVDDNHYKGWDVLFKHIIKDIYGDLVEYSYVDFLNKTESQIHVELDKLFRSANEDTIFILDNQLGLSLTGLDYLKLYKINAILNTADSIGFEAAKNGALFYMMKDNPSNPMSNEELKNMMILFHKTIIKHFRFIPELIWLVYNKLN